MATPNYDYYLVENTYVARFDPQTQVAERLMPDGTWVETMRTREVFDGQPLKDETDALDTVAFILARNKEREAARRGGS